MKQNIIGREKIPIQKGKEAQTNQNRQEESSKQGSLGVPGVLERSVREAQFNTLKYIISITQPASGVVLITANPVVHRNLAFAVEVIFDDPDVI